MAQVVRGPGLMISQFIGTAPPFDTLPGIAGWAADLGFLGLQIPVHDRRIVDVEALAKGDAAIRALRDTLGGLEITELSAHRAGQLLAVHPAYDDLADVFAPPDCRGDPRKRRGYAQSQLMSAIDAAARLEVGRIATFSGALAWPFFYPWPPPPRGLIERAFDELANRWRPILQHAKAREVDICFELHPGEDVHDGVTFERFLDRLDGHERIKILYDPSHMLIQHMDYLGFIDRYHDRIAAFHVKDAEFTPSDRSGVYGGYQDWIDRPGRFRSPGDGQIDFKGIFSRLARWHYKGWAVLEWECCLKQAEDGAREGAQFVRDHIIRLAETSFDAPLRADASSAQLDQILGLARE